MTADGAGHLDGGALAVYALGALGTAEAAVAERHMLGCGACTEQLAELAEVRNLLSLVPASLVLEDPALAGPEPASRGRAYDAGRAPGTSSRTAAVPGHNTRTRDRWRVRMSAVAIAGAAIAGAVVAPVLVAGSGEGVPAAVMTLIASDRSAHIVATMWLRPGPGDSTFELRLVGPIAGSRLRVVADRRDGPPVSAGQWQIPRYPAGTVFDLRGSVDVTVTELTGFRVLAPGG